MTRSSKTCNKFYIIGPRRLQNELIASYLVKEIRNEAILLENVNQIPKDNPGNPKHSNFVLWECQGKDPKNLIAELKTYTRQTRSSNRVILFNVPHDLEFKKKFVLKGIHGFFL
ncbi:MAG: hypothetical protein R6U40_01700 [Desulfobacterales bacterium]